MHFLLLMASHFPKNMFVRDAFLETFLDLFMLVLYEKGRFGEPFKIQWAPKWDPKSTKWHQKATKKQKPVPLWGSPGTSLFPESIRIEDLMFLL